MAKNHSVSGECLVTEPMTLTEWVEGQILEVHNRHAIEALGLIPPDLRDEVHRRIIAIEVEMARIYAAATGLRVWEGVAT